jgi:hypothetical protein
MKRRQKAFLVVGVPFVVVTAALSLVSMTASVCVTMLGLLVFGIAYSRPSGRSLALAPCVFCARKIIFEHEGEYCATCDHPVHAKCLDEHRMKEHVAAPTQPFR